MGTLLKTVSFHSMERFSSPKPVARDNASRLIAGNALVQNLEELVQSWSRARKP
jgi:hypothetical protein